MQLVLALRRAQQLALEAFPEALLAGPDVGAHGGPYHATLGLRDAHGASRVLDLPRNATAAFGIARGLALAGHRVICELPREDAARAASALAQDVAAWSQAEAATVQASWGRASPAASPSPVGPIVLRVPVARDADLSPWSDAVGPGVHVIAPTTPEDAFAAVAAGISAARGVVVVLEAESLYRSGADTAPEVGPLEAATLPSGSRVVASPSGGAGTAPAAPDQRVPPGPTTAPSGAAVTAPDLVILAAGAGVPRAREAAQALAREGFTAAVHDLRVLSPLDLAGLAERVASCGRAVLHVDAGPLGERLSSALTARAFLSLEAPLRAVPVSSGLAPLLAACRETLDF